MQFFTGARVGEIRGLTWDAHFDQDKINFNARKVNENREKFLGEIMELSLV